MSGPSQFSAIPAISKETLSVLQVLGFTTATPVQEAVIPLFSGNKDVAVDACTGSGKTLAFVVPVIEKLRKLDDKLKRHQVSSWLLGAWLRIVCCSVYQLPVSIGRPTAPAADCL